MRIGHGYDVHKFGGEGPLTIAGVKIDYEFGFLAHSDGDVAVHALCDAILGALALGDIGKHFPDTDERFKGISSLILLKHVGELLQAKNYKINNIDATIVAQRPKLLPFIPTMQKNVAETLNLPIEDVNIKATTEERLGFTGNEEGISSYAVCSIDKLNL